MSRALRSPRGPLWAEVGEDQADTLPLWKAALAAIALEVVAPILVFGVDWSFLAIWQETPTPVMSVRLDAPPPEPAPPTQEHKPKREPKDEQIQQIAVDLPKPVPNETAKILLPQPERKPKPKPPPAPEPPEEKPPEPEPEAPPLPSVFRDVKPVKRVQPIYPREAEDAHIQGRVKVRMSVDLEGTVTQVQILLAEPPGVFDEAVLTAVRQYKFKQDGTTYQADEEVIFKLDD